MGRKLKPVRRQVRHPRGNAARGRAAPKPGAPHDWRFDRISYSTLPAGPDVVTAGLDEVAQAIERAPRGDDWPSVSKLVIPVIPRVRPQPPGAPPAFRVLLPPGVHVGFGIDIGPAFMAISPPQVELLGISGADLVSQAITNLSARAAQVDSRAIVRQAVDGTPVVALQTGLSIASALILIPEQLARIFGPEPRLFVSPMRDVLLGFPVDVDPWLAGSLYEDIASQDPNCLAPIAYRFEGTTITIAMIGAEAPATRRLLA
jgi:hypothetical protein